MGESDRQPLVTAKTAKTICAYLDLIETATEGDLLDGLESLREQLGELGMDAIPALAAGLDRTGGRAKIMAAWFIGHIEQQRPGLIRDKELLSRAAETLVAALKQQDVHARLFACSCLTYGNVPKKAVSVLR
ncbi:MAG TPA: hypothetical protein VHC19_08400, partial [Pirellulales bacterium]|nr:hypothetical protein [Pirellulales bacterium]